MVCLPLQRVPVFSCQRHQVLFSRCQLFLQSKPVGSAHCRPDLLARSHNMEVDNVSATANGATAEGKPKKQVWQEPHVGLVLHWKPAVQYCSHRYVMADACMCPIRASCLQLRPEDWCLCIFKPCMHINMWPLAQPQPTVRVLLLVADREASQSIGLLLLIACFQ